MLPEQEKAIEKSSAQEYDDLTTARPAKLAWRSTWLDQRAYNAVNHDWRPLRRGIMVLAVALGHCRYLPASWEPVRYHDLAAN